jgi:membrane protease YdiL (CAAX protease family)
VFGAKLVAAMGFNGDIAPAMAYKVGFAALLMALLLMSDKVKTVSLNLSIGFIEEVVFRGLLFHWLAKHSKVKIVLLSSMIFGLFHGLNILSGDDIRVVMWLVPGVVFFVWGLVLLYRMDRVEKQNTGESAFSS